MKDFHLGSNIPTSQQLPLVSIYWDYQNAHFSLDKANLLLDFAHSKGRVISKNVYYNSQRKDQSAAKDNIANLGFSCLDVPCPLKNSADNQLIADCLDHIHSSNMTPDIVILVSGDGDFVKLVHNLQKLGKRVIIFAQIGNVKQKLKEVADEFYFIDTLPELMENKILTQSANVESQIDYNQVIEYLIEAIKTALSQSKSTSFGCINNLMLQSCPRYQGFSCISMPNGKKLKNFTRISHKT
jgi:NYN domain